ncbi:caspase family protein [Oceanicoccus sagamiensis]|uniref:Uncharacterized protein n=1 Tax=Oceanicoccus sagamiensis TaxID=716816 RepID=A0A1X9N726_9GAMM|nr:caspase family protein [Oceanicoccus sagamiensis]ARN73506.1 hypothetical protein BST96_04865 [Oceanicoccus sagamiensis]
MRKKTRKALVVSGGAVPADSYGVSAASSFASVVGTNGDRTANFSTQINVGFDSALSLRSMISDFFSLRAEDLLFFYTGFGFVNESGGCLLAPDYERSGDWVSIGDLLSHAGKARAANKIVILDLFPYSNKEALLPGSPRIFIGQGVVLLAANRRVEETVDKQHCGAFMAVLLDALRGGAADLKGDISMASVYAYIDRALGERSPRPLFMTNTSCLSPLRSIEPQVPLCSMKKIVEYFPQPEALYRLDPSFEASNQIQHSAAAIKPFAIKKNIDIFNHLKKLQGIGLVMPVDASCMYLAAMDSKACNLTLLGQHYWRLIRNGSL